MTSNGGRAVSAPNHVFALWHSYSATVNNYAEVDFPRLLGVYSTQAGADEALARAITLPGFNGDLVDTDSVEGLVVERREVGDISWRGGFFSYYADGREE